MKKLRIGVVGMGIMGDAHSRIYQSLPEVDLVGGVECCESIRIDIQNRFNIPVYSSIEPLFDIGVDALSICTPEDQHKEYILKAFEKKVKVLVEKPLETSANVADEIIAKRPGPEYLMIGHNVRFDPSVILCKKAVQEGKLGKILSFNIKRCSSVSCKQRVGNRTSVTWFLGIHDVDLMLWITGLKVQKDTSLGFKCNSKNWDYVTAQIILENGVIALTENHWLLPESRSSGIEASIKIIGDKAMIETDMGFNDFSISHITDCQRYCDTHYQPDDYQGIPSGDLYRELQCFVKCVVGNKVPPITGEEALEAIKVVELMEKMIREVKII